MAFKILNVMHTIKFFMFLIALGTLLPSGFMTEASGNVLYQEIITSGGGTIVTEGELLIANTGNPDVTIMGIAIIDSKHGYMMDAISDCNRSICLVSISTLPAGNYDVIVDAFDGYSFSEKFMKK